MKVADDVDASPKTMERIIERDAAITAKILRVANSAYYGLHSVPSLGRAISILGMSVIRSLVVGVAYQQIISGRPQAKLFNKSEFWKHSLATAVGARILGKMKMPLRAEELYVAGMMHDVGMLVMDRFGPTELDQAIKLASDDEIPMYEAEQRTYGFDHTAVGALLCQRWGLTQTIESAVRFHHDVFSDDKCVETTMIVAAANTMACQLGLSTFKTPISYDMDPLVKSELGMADEQLVVIGNVMVQEVQRAQEAFHIR